MRYVYVLVSAEDDFYYEQALMSVVSLRLHMPRADVLLLTDDRTSAGFAGKRAEILKHITSVITVPFGDEVRNVERSRLIKTAIPDYVDGDFLYIDCDTVICEDLDGIEDEPYELAGVLDCHVMIEEHVHKEYFLARDRRLGFSGTRAAGCNFNGGLVLCRDTALGREFFRKWNEAWKHSAYEKHDLHDQPALNQANYLTGLRMRQLDGKWNCQPCHGGLRYLGSAKIIHYFSSEIQSDKYVPYYALADKALLRRVKESGGVPDDVMDMLRTPRFQFGKVHLVSDQRIVDIMQSPLTFTIADMKAHARPLFALLEGTARAARSLGKRLRGKR